MIDFSELREPCRVCGKEIPEAEFHAYGGEICEDCTATRYKRFKAPGCFAISDMLSGSPQRHGSIPSDSDDLDAEYYEKQLDEREAEHKVVRKPEPLSKRKQQLYDKHKVAANSGK